MLKKQSPITLYSFLLSPKQKTPRVSWDAGRCVVPPKFRSLRNRHFDSDNGLARRSILGALVSLSRPHSRGVFTGFGNLTADSTEEALSR